MKRNSFALMEVMIAAAILVIVLVGLLAVYSGCFSLNERARNSTIAMNGIQEKLEEIRNCDFSQILTDYSSGDTFTIERLDGLGVIYINSGDPDLLNITISVSWRQKGGRIIGEDTDLDGEIDVGEDVNTNGILDSPAMVTTLMAER